MPNFPLGLPEGSIRGLIAIWFAGVTGFLWATGGAVPEPLLVTTTGVIAYYFAARTAAQGTTNITASDANIDLAKPFIPGETTDEGIQIGK